MDNPVSNKRNKMTFQSMTIINRGLQFLRTSEVIQVRVKTVPNTDFELLCISQNRLHSSTSLSSMAHIAYNLCYVLLQSMIDCSSYHKFCYNQLSVLDISHRTNVTPQVRGVIKKFVDLRYINEILNILKHNIFRLHNKLGYMFSIVVECNGMTRRRFLNVSHEIKSLRILITGNV